MEHPIDASNAGADSSGFDPTWFKDAIIYEVHVKSFCDSDGDGIGDFPGLTSKLDYLQDLGVTTLWVLPFYPSPLKDDGYDIAHYTDIHPSYGTLRDFQEFLAEAHRRGLRVITELVINHTSDQHPWFQRARRAPVGSAHREFYVWSDSGDRYADARIIFKDFEQSNWSWDPIAQSYYWHRFYGHQPDLNFENPDVHQAVFEALDFWLGLGVDGLRLDAIPYLYEEDGTNCENLPQTHQFLKALRQHVDEHYPGRMLLAEANQWPEDSIAYFGDGDECHMAFHFPVMPRMFMALRMEDRTPIIDILNQTPTIPEGCQWAMFLRNHDELTLEMVTDEERDYMYRSYAQDPEARINLGIRRRLGPLLGNDRRRIELLNGLLFSLPGTPVLYYGDEIGMGDNVYLGDRNGVRTPMQWSGDRNAGFSRANPHRLYLPIIVDSEYHYQTVNVEAQSGNLHSLLWWTKRLIALRKRYAAFGRGSIEFLHPENRRVLAFIRQHEDETILVVANLSRFVQCAELDLGAFKESVPIELFGQTKFPPIGELPYFLTLGPHSFFMFALSSPAKMVHEEEAADRTALPHLSATESWEGLLRGRGRLAFERILPRYLRSQRWFGGKARTIKAVSTVEDILLPGEARSQHLALVRVEYNDGEPDLYVLPLAFASTAEAEALRDSGTFAPIATIHVADSGEDGVIYDGFGDPSFATGLLEVMRQESRFDGMGAVTGSLSAAWWQRERQGELRREDLTPAPSRAEQSNSSVRLGDQAILKLFRRIVPGVNPELEIGRLLTERAEFSHAASVLGQLEYRIGRDPMTLAVLQAYIPNFGDAWRHTLGELERYFEYVSTFKPDQGDPVAGPVSLLERAGPARTTLAHDLIDGYLEAARLLGVRTAELHRALASQTTDPAFAPEPITMMHQRSMYQSMRSQLSRSFDLLTRRRSRLSGAAALNAERALDREGEIHRRLRAILERRLDATRIRIHGDYHLGQVLYTGGDFVIIDFEGEPSRPLSERRIKRSPLRDVAGMIRSFDYAAHTALALRSETASAEEIAEIEPWARYWYSWVAATFLDAYRDAAAGSSFLPSDPQALEVLLHALLLQKAIYELEYELNNRPGWLSVPLLGILRLIEAKD